MHNHSTPQFVYSGWKYQNHRKKYMRRYHQDEVFRRLSISLNRTDLKYSSLKTLTEKGGDFLADSCSMLFIFIIFANTDFRWKQLFRVLYKLPSVKSLKLKSTPSQIRRWNCQIDFSFKSFKSIQSLLIYFFLKRNNEFPRLVSDTQINLIRFCQHQTWKSFIFFRIRGSCRNVLRKSFFSHLEICDLHSIMIHWPLSAKNLRNICDCGFDFLVMWFKPINLIHLRFSIDQFPF